jgi:hypothetical protein
MGAHHQGGWHRAAVNDLLPNADLLFTLLRQSAIATRSRYASNMRVSSQ